MAATQAIHVVLAVVAVLAAFEHISVQVQACVQALLPTAVDQGFILSTWLILM
jgi:hypothetical protein